MAQGLTSMLSRRGSSLFGISILSSSCQALKVPFFVCHACSNTHDKRFQSSYRRTRKALRVKPEPSFRPSKTELRDHIIFNPPSSAPNVYQTPSKFLPVSDPRRRLHPPTGKVTTGATTSTPISSTSSSLATLARAKLAQRFEATTASTNLSSTSSPFLPPSIRPIYEKKYHLTQAQIDEIRTLRTSDPHKWTRTTLAEKFNCSSFFISLVCAAPQEIKDERARHLESVKRKWGRRKTEAREARVERKKLWGKDA